MSGGRRLSHLHVILDKIMQRDSDSILYLADRTCYDRNLEGRDLGVAAGGHTAGCAALGQVPHHRLMPLTRSIVPWRATPPVKGRDCGVQLLHKALDG